MDIFSYYTRYNKLDILCLCKTGFTGLTIDALKKHNKDQSPSITSRYGKRRGMGIKIEANGQDVALFHWKDKIYCTDENCPHAGEGGMGMRI